MMLNMQMRDRFRDSVNQYSTPCAAIWNRYLSGERPFLVSAPSDSDEPFAERWPPAAYFVPRRAIEQLQACFVEYARRAERLQA